MCLNPPPAPNSYLTPFDDKAVAQGRPPRSLLVSAQAHDRSARPPSLTHRLHAHAGNELSHPRPCRLLTLTQAALSPSLSPSLGRKDHPSRGRSGAMRGHGHLRTAESHSLPSFLSIGPSLAFTHRLAESEQSHPRPCRLTHPHTDCTRTRRANRRTRARAGSSSRTDWGSSDATQLVTPPEGGCSHTYCC